MVSLIRPMSQNMQFFLTAPLTHLSLKVSRFSYVYLCCLCKIVFSQCISLVYEICIPEENSGRGIFGLM